MVIQSKKYAVMRNNRTEILCGIKGYFRFHSVKDLKNKTIKTYKTPHINFPYILHGDKSGYEIVPVVETIQIPDEKSKEE